MEELKSLGRYKIRGVLGKGAMGLVYDGLDPNLNRRVAIKTILTRKLDAEAARMISVRFEREVRAVARLNHRNITNCRTRPSIPPCGAPIRGGARRGRGVPAVRRRAA